MATNINTTSDVATEAIGNIIGDFLGYLFHNATTELKNKENNALNTEVNQFIAMGIEHRLLQHGNWKKLQEAMRKHKLTGENAGECWSIINTIKTTAWWF